MITSILISDALLKDTALRKCIYNKQYTIVPAVDGYDALDLIEGRSIDLIIIDMDMPVLDGYGFLEQFSKTPYISETPVIAVLEADDPAKIEKVLCYDVFDVLIKPLEQTNSHIFSNKIRSALKLRSCMQKHQKPDTL